MAWLWTTISVPLGVLLLVNDTRTQVSQIRAAHTTPLSAILDDLLTLSYKDVEDDGVRVVYNANTCQGLIAFDANTDHFAVERGIFSGAAKDEMKQGAHAVWEVLYPVFPTTIFRNAAMDSPFFTSVTLKSMWLL